MTNLDDSENKNDYEHCLYCPYCKTSDNPLYIDTCKLVYNICIAKRDLILDPLSMEDENFEDTFDFTCNVIEELINDLTNRHSRYNKIDPYVKLLLTYDKYNKLHALKNNTKLNNDVIFNLIIKYL